MNQVPPAGASNEYRRASILDFVDSANFLDYVVVEAMSFDDGSSTNFWLDLGSVFEQDRKPGKNTFERPELS